MNLDYSQLPWYAKAPFRRWHKLWCALGQHVPMGVFKDNSGQNIDYFCQECMRSVDKNAWVKFWSGAYSFPWLRLLRRKKTK